MLFDTMRWGQKNNINDWTRCDRRNYVYIDIKYSALKGIRHTELVKYDQIKARQEKKEDDELIFERKMFSFSFLSSNLLIRKEIKSLGSFFVRINCVRWLLMLFWPVNTNKCSVYLCRRLSKKEEKEICLRTILDDVLWFIFVVICFPLRWCFLAFSFYLLTHTSSTYEDKSSIELTIWRFFRVLFSSVHLTLEGRT